MPYSLKWLLLQAASPIKQTLHKIAEKHGLSTMQLWTLNLIEAEKEVPMNTISHSLSCDASNVTGLIDRLLAMELVERHEYSLDRRIKMVRLTEKGKNLKVLLMEELEETAIENLTHLTDEEQIQLKELLLKIIV